MKTISSLYVAAVVTSTFVAFSPTAFAESAKTAMSVTNVALVRANTGSQNWDKVLGATSMLRSRRNL